MGPSRRGEEAGEERLVRGVGKRGRRVPRLPHTLRQHRRQVRRATGGERVARHVVAQRVQGHEQHVVRADQVASVEHPRLLTAGAVPSIVSTS